MAKNTKKQKKTAVPADEHMKYKDKYVAKNQVESACTENVVDFNAELQEAFENLILSDEDLEKLGNKGLESLRTINKILDKHKLDKKDVAKAFSACYMNELKKAEPKKQLEDIKTALGDTPRTDDTEKAINCILEEVMMQVPKGMTYIEFTKEYELVAKPRNKKSFFEKFFKRNK